MTPPEQRADDELWSHACKNCGNAEALHLRVPGYWCKKFERGEEFKQDAVYVDNGPEIEAAHPEAVRMPELRNLADLSDEDRKFGKDMALATKYFYSKLEFVAANLHAEIAAHERTRAEKIAILTRW